MVNVRPVAAEPVDGAVAQRGSRTSAPQQQSSALCFPPAVLLTNSIEQKKKDETLSSLAAVPRVVIMEAADLADSVSQ